MPKTSLLAPTCLALAIVASILLAGCGAPPDHESATADAPSPGVAWSGQAGNDAACEEHPLRKAMPSATRIGGLPFAHWECTFNRVRAVYGKEGGNALDITLTDTRSPALNQQPAAAVPMLRSSDDTLRSLTKFTVQGTVETRKAMEAQPMTLQVIGGPDHLPVIETAPNNEPVVILVGMKDDPSKTTVTSLLKDRYVLNVQAYDKDGAVNSLTGPQARTLYDPFLKELHLDRLP